MEWPARDGDSPVNENEHSREEHPSCYIVGVSRATIDRWRDDPSKPPAVKQGIRIYYRESELKSYMAQLSLR
jgi:predicted DNA-binding transcriptional regulator AlpA